MNLIQFWLVWLLKKIIPNLILTQIQLINYEVRVDSVYYKLCVKFIFWWK